VQQVVNPGIGRFFQDHGDVFFPGGALGETVGHPFHGAALGMVDHQDRFLFCLHLPVLDSGC